MVYYICHCMSLHVCPGDSFILASRLAFLWLSTRSVLIVMPLL